MTSSFQFEKPVVIIGFGGHGKVCAAAILASGRKVLAATDLQSQQVTAFDFPILTDEQAVEKFSPEQVELVLGLGSIWPSTSDSARPKCAARFETKGYRFTGFQHPTAWVAPNCRIAETAQIHAGVIIQPGCTIGEHVILNTRCSVDHDGQIGSYCHLAPGVTTSGNVTLGEGCHVGTGANLVQNIELDAHCFVAAGATVVKSASQGTYLRGTPAREFTPANPR